MYCLSKLRKIIALSCLNFCFSFILQAQQNQDPFDQIISYGEIPDDFLQSTTIKIENYKETEIGDFSSNKDFIIRSFYTLDDILLSGRVTFGDPVTNYINKIADQILKNKPELRNELKFYSLKSPKFNASSTPHGIIFVNTGIMAYVANESQLAFILCHEIAHYICKHSITTYTLKEKVFDDKGIYSKVPIDERIEYYFSHSREKEIEADSVGISLFLESGYDTDEIMNSLDLLHYSYLPFGNKEFDITFFNYCDFQIPTVLFKDSLSAVLNVDNEKDDYSLHPSISKRKGIAARMLEGKDRSGEKFIVSDNHFNELVIQCQFECLNQSLSLQDYAETIYAAYLLLDKFPDNTSLRVFIAKALYGLAKFRNIDKFHLVISPYSKIEGESQQLYYFLRQLSPVQLNTLAIKYIHQLRKEYPCTILDELEVDLINDIVINHNVRFEDFYSPRKEFAFPSFEETRYLNQEEILRHRKNCNDFHLNAFCSEKQDTYLINRFKIAELIKAKQDSVKNQTYKEKMKQNRTNEENIRNIGLPYKFNQALIVDPAYINLNFSSRELDDGYEKYKLLLDQVALITFAAHNNIHLLSMKKLSKNSVTDYNLLSMMLKLRNEILTIDQDNILPLSLPPKTMKEDPEKTIACFPVVLDFNNEMHYYFSCYDLSTGRLIYKNTARLFSFGLIKDLFRKDLEILKIQ